MDCSCEFSAGVDEFMDVISKSWREARKRHKCYECGRDIPPGEQYRREFCAGGGGQQEVFKTCSDCMSIRENLVHDFYYGQVLDLVFDEIHERDGEIPERCIAALTPAARAWVCEEIENVWEEEDDE